MWEQLKRRSSYQALPTLEPKKQTDLFRDLHHPVFQSIRIIQVYYPLELFIVFFSVFNYFFLFRLKIQEIMESFKLKQL